MMDALERQARRDTDFTELIRRVSERVGKLGRKVEFLESNAEVARPMRLSFETKTALDAFTGWPGLIGFVEADNSEYVWRSGWKLQTTQRIAFVPTATGLTVGNGTWSCSYIVSAGVCYVAYRFIFGSTSAITGLVSLGIPLSSTGPLTFGGGEAVDMSAGTFPLDIRYAAPTVYIRTLSASGAHAAKVDLSATVPMAWTTTDEIRASIAYTLS